MSNSVKSVLGAVVLILVAVGLYFGIQWYENGKNTAGSAVFSSEPAVLPTGENLDDNSLTKDTAVIDAELKGLDADTASAEASLSESAEVQ